MDIEIFNKKTKEVVETIKNVTGLKGFLYYWRNQCDDKVYGYRIVPFKRLQKVEK